jgi:hypothetical protein
MPTKALLAANKESRPQPALAVPLTWHGLTDCATLPFVSATPGPPKNLPGIWGAVPRTRDQSPDTSKSMYAPPAELDSPSDSECNLRNSWRSSSAGASPYAGRDGI